MFTIVWRDHLLFSSYVNDSTLHSLSYLAEVRGLLFSRKAGSGRTLFVPARSAEIRDWQPGEYK